MSFLKSKGFKYVKNLIIGLGAGVVLIGALFKILSWPYANEMLIAGMLTEAFIFVFLGLIGPEKDYYWEKLYPGLDRYNSKLMPLTEGVVGVAQSQPPAPAQVVNNEVMEEQLGGMLVELQTISSSISALKSLQDLDYSGTSDHIKAMSHFYAKLNEAMADLADSLEDTKRYKEQLVALNDNISNLNNTYEALNSTYSSVISTMSNIRQQ